jgi:YVTN family beta-propeller protein
VEFRILGPLQVLDRGVDVPLGSPKERALLAVLLLHQGAVVSRERLIDELWGESPPPTAEKALNVHVSQLRKALGPNGQATITTRHPGYAVVTGPEQLDATRFERLVADAQTQVSAGDVAFAAELLRDGLAIWRGPALAGIELESAGRNEANRLDELRLAAQMDRIDCDLARGSHEELIGELEALVADHPLRERLRGQLMLALYRSGRQADALGCYRQARETLVGELGIEPSPALQRLEKAILNHDRSLEAPAGVTRAETPFDHLPAERSPGRIPLRIGRVAPSRRWLALASALIVGGIAAGVAVSHSSERPLLVPPNAVGVIDPHSDRVVATIRVGGRPGPLAYTNGTAWVANVKDLTLTRIEARTRHVVGATPLGGSYPSALAADDGVVWSGDPIRAAVTRVAGGNLQTISIEQPALGVTNRSAAPCPTHIGLAMGGGSVWVVCGPAFGRAILTAIDPLTGTQDAAIYTPANDPAAITYADGSLWVANFDANNVTELNPLDRSVVRTITVAAAPVAIAAYAGSVWVVGSEQDAVSRIAIATDTGSPVVTTIHVGHRPNAIASGAGAVWVTNQGDRTVSRIDPETSRVTATIPIGAEPWGMTVGGGMVWVSAQAAPSP